MKIVHVMALSPVTDNWGYQDNLLTKYHKLSGYDVTMITTKWIREESKLIKTEKCNYINEDGVKVIRLSIKHDKDFYDKFKRLNGLYETLEKEKPDILFIHGCQFLDISVIVKFLKHHNNIKVFVDSHSDLSNSASNWLSKNVLHKIVWRHMAQKINPFVTKFYGVTPARVDFLKEMYQLPSDKCELLIMGVDPEVLRNISVHECKNEIRKKFGIQENEFLIVTGGKINQTKKETLLLMDAVNKLPIDKIKLLIFGSVSSELKEEFDAKCNSEKIIYAGWISTSETYHYIAAADLVFFPGKHSVLWEQTVGQGIPLVCQYIKGFDHIDIGGNAKLISCKSADEISNILVELLSNNKKEYLNMKKVAESENRKQFWYDQIAEKSIRGE